MLLGAVGETFDTSPLEADLRTAFLALELKPVKNIVRRCQGWLYILHLDGNDVLEFPPPGAFYGSGSSRRNNTAHSLTGLPL